MMSYYLTNQRDSVYQLQDQIASGKAVTVASDNPGAYDLVARLTTSESCIEQYLLNTKRLQSDLLESDNCLTQITDKLQRVSEIIINCGDSSMTPEYQEAAAAEVDVILEDIVALANSNPNGRYLFAGLRTDTPAYEVTRDAEGYITDVTYQGNSEVRQVEIAKGVYNPANIPGSDTSGGAAVFETQTTDLFGSLIQLRDRLAAGENLVALEGFTADAGSDTLTVSNQFSTGCSVTLSTEDGTLPSGLDPDRSYYVIKLSDTQIQLADTMENARAGIAVDFTDNGSGTLTLTQESLTDNEREIDHMLTMLSSIGSQEKRMELNITYLTNQQENNLKGLERERDLDVTQAVTELEYQKSAYEASLRITSSLLEISLVNMI
jgi:flagellar hook-associated protein 3 FlgL